jgi:hypothetical protein
LVLLTITSFCFATLSLFILSVLYTSGMFWVQFSSGQRGQFLVHHGCSSEPLGPIPHDSLQYPGCWPSIFDRSSLTKVEKACLIFTVRNTFIFKHNFRRDHIVGAMTQKTNCFKYRQMIQCTYERYLYGKRSR